MNNMSLVIGNLCSFLAMVTDSIGSAQKTAKRVLIFQSISQAIYCIGTIILKGYSGAVQNAVSVLRNIVAIKEVENKTLEWAFVISGVVLGVCFNNMGLMGYLPIVANLQYTLAIFRFQNNERALKKSFLVSIIMFTVFNIAIYNIVGVASNLVVLITTAAFLLKPNKAQQ